MEEKLQIRASLGSKLPKFGGPKSSGSFIQRPPNGTHSALNKSNLVGEKHSDHDRTSGFSMNWRKLKCQPNGHFSKDLPNAVTEKKFSPYHITVEKDTQKSGKHINMLLSQKEDLNENLLSNSNKFTKSAQYGRSTYSGLNGCKTQVNGFYTNKPPTGLHRPRANSATSRNFPRASSENKPFPNVRRSQSFSHSVQNSLLPNTPLTRSHSFNKEVDPTRPYQSPHIPVQPAVRQNTLTRTVKQYGLSNGNDPQMKSSFTRPYSTGSSLGLKKPGFSSSPAVSVPLGYRMSRPSLQKTNRIQLTRENICNDSKGSSPALLMDKLEPLSNGTCQRPYKDMEEDLDIDNCSSCENLDKPNGKDSYYSEDVDELSISSLSSSDKNDFSEDFSDDFLDFEEGDKTITDVDPENKVSGKQSEQLLTKLQDKKQTDPDHSDEWIGVNISVQKEAETSSSPCRENGISPDMDYRDPSSLELSPSDSSGGTYMWDEEGMEPIGNVHPCGSYDSSEMNSLDILNNLDSCDLEDDDLMLDVDLPEDTTCDMGKVENMSHFERTERSFRQQQQVFWKRPPPRLNGQEQYHLSNPDHYHNGRGSSCLQSPTDLRESYGSPNFYSPSPRSTQIMGLRDNTVILDEMTLCHMVQDCTTVKTQLLKLKRLLQQEGDPESPVQEIPPSFPTTPEPPDTDTLVKTDDLLREIQQLKEESRKKDETIKQLQQQLKTPCKCQKEEKEPKVVKPKQHDKYTQTTARRSSPQILQRSISTPSTTDHTSGKLIAHPHTELQSIPKDNTCDPVSYWHKEDTGPVTDEVPEKELSDLLNMQLKIDDNPENVKEEADSNNHEPLDNNKNRRPQEALDALTTFPVNAKKNIRSKVNVNSAAELPGEILKSKTLQLRRPKMHNALAQKGVVSAASSNTSSKEPQMLNPVLSTALTQSSNDSQSMVQKCPPRTYNDSSSHQQPKQVISDSALRSLDSLCSVIDSQSHITMPGTKQLGHNLPPPVRNSKLSSEVALPTETPVPVAETSKPVSKLMPKGTMLRPPSKLKKPNSSKLDASNEPQKSPVKFSPTVVTRPLSNKKESLQENIESLVQKRQSRLPQPKAH